MWVTAAAAARVGRVAGAATTGANTAPCGAYKQRSPAATQRGAGTRNANAFLPARASDSNRSGGKYRIFRRQGKRERGSAIEQSVHYTCAVRCCVDTKAFFHRAMCAFFDAQLAAKTLSITEY